MPEQRPDPDQLLVHLKAEEARAKRGRLRIFFGATAGVGKTYAMLEAARAARAGGTDIVLGYVEPHGRVETERLMEGLERVPTLAVRYRDIVRQEFDLDAALGRHPAILIVDELAHSNLSGGDPAPRHPKRWQDIEELLEAGIDVWTTVNVQHLESLNDLVAQITGVKQRETLPDRIFDEADEVELIDLPPEDLLARLRAGKIYVQQDAGTATDRFFRKPNLLALRELALRRTTDRVQAAARASLATDGSIRTWLASDRVLVATGPDPQSEQTIRAGKRLADALDAEWTVVYVETPALLRLSEKERDRRIALLRLAESLGAETVTLDGPSAVDALLEYAATRQFTRVVVGAPKRRGWRALLRPSAATELALRANGFDVITIAATERSADPMAAERRARAEEIPQPIRWRRYLAAVAITAVCTISRAFQSGHALSTGSDRDRFALRARAVGAGRGIERRRLRFLLCAAAVHLCGQRCAVPHHFRCDADDRAGHRDSHGKRAATDPRGRRARAAHCVVVWNEPRADRYARLREHGENRG
jgi:two-component system sensor histidine kinase KdpD